MYANAYITDVADLILGIILGQWHQRNPLWDREWRFDFALIWNQNEIARSSTLTGNIDLSHMIVMD